MASFTPGMKAGSAKPAPPAPAPVVRAEPVHRAPPRPAAPLDDIEAMLNIVSSIYHFDDGHRKHGVVYPAWNRVREWLEKMK